MGPSRTDSSWDSTKHHSLEATVEAVKDTHAVANLFSGCCADVGTTNAGITRSPAITHHDR